jgi:predicted dehydrogenase
MVMKLAFLGFRHGHIMGLYKAAQTHPELQVVGACEEDDAAAETIRDAGAVTLTHGSFEEILRNVECDAVAVGDYYSRRGEIVLRALEAGKHVISDKPICIRRSELEQIQGLAGRKRRAVGCLLDLRGSGVLRTMRRLIREGAIGEVHTVLFTAQHPLLWGKRPEWYFDKEKHGGTINDIAIHATDAIPWLTGRRFVEVTAARAWNAKLKQAPHFQDAAQLMLRLDNDGGVFGDVSYLAPDGCGYAVPQYWRFTCHGSEGVVEASLTSKQVMLATHNDKAPRTIEHEPDVPNAAVEAFLDEIAGRKASLTTRDVLEASRVALMVQEAADRGATGMKV